MTDLPILLITGASGYIGSWIVKLALESNKYKVRGTIRGDPQDSVTNGYEYKNLKENIILNDPKYKHLKKLNEDNEGRLTLFKADLLYEEGSTDKYWEKIVKGCTYIIHTAAVFKFEESRNPSELIDPAVKGTENVLNAIVMNDCLKHIVITSSIVSIGYGFKINYDIPIDEKTKTNTENSKYKIPTYFKAKALAEEKAIEMYNKKNLKGIKMSVINPGLVLGPSLSTNNCESLQIIANIASGKESALPDIYTYITSIKDVANAHLLVLDKDIPTVLSLKLEICPSINIGDLDKKTDTPNRFLLAAQELSLCQISDILQKEFIQYGYKPTKKTLSNFLLSIGSLFNDKKAKAFNLIVSRKLNIKCKNVKEILKLDIDYNISKLINDTFYSIISNKICKLSINIKTKDKINENIDRINQEYNIKLPHVIQLVN